MCVGFFSPPLPPFVRSVWFVYFQVCLFHLISNSPNSIIRKNKKKLQTHFKEKPSVSTGNTKKMWYDEFCRRSSILYKRYFISHKFASAEKTFGRIEKNIFLYFYFFVLYMCAKFHQHRTKTSDTFKSTYWAIPLRRQKEWREIQEKNYPITSGRRLWAATKTWAIVRAPPLTRGAATGRHCWECEKFCRRL